MKVPCLRGFVVCCANSYWLLAIDTYVRYDTVCTATGGGTVRTSTYPLVRYISIFGRALHFCDFWLNYIHTYELKDY